MKNSAIDHRQLPSSFGEWAWRHITRARAFALIAGTGLAIDLLLFSTLIRLDRSAGAASLVSGSLACAFVYFASARRIFRCHSQFLIGLFAVYLAWQALSVVAAAYAVNLLVRAGAKPIVAKLLILPITFPANYAIMSLLTARWSRACKEPEA